MNVELTTIELPSFLLTCLIAAMRGSTTTDSLRSFEKFAQVEGHQRTTGMHLQVVYGSMKKWM